MTYQDLRLLGQMEHGVYNDQVDNIDPAILYCYYGAAKCEDDHPSFNSDSNDSDEDSSDNLEDDPSGSDSGSTSVSESGSESTSVSGSESESSSVSGDSSTNSYSDSNYEYNPTTDSESDSEPTSQSAIDSGTSDSDSGSDVGSEHGETGSTLGAEDGQIISQQEIADIISRAQKRNIRHEAAAVAASATPFENSDEAEAFADALDALESGLSSGEYPAGYGLNDEYESIETYKTGRSSKPLVIALPHNIWFPRIVVWCKALDLLKRLPMCRDLAV